MNKITKMLFVLIISIVLISGCFSGSDKSDDLEAKDNTQPTNTSDSDVESNKDTVDFTDCGISRSLKDGMFEENIDFESDDALVCMGEAILDECRPAKALVDTSDVGQVKYEIKKIDGVCIIKTEYGDEEQIQLESQRIFANKFSECPAAIETTKDQLEEDINNIPGALAFGVYFYAAIEFMNPNTECTGSLLEIRP